MADAHGSDLLALTQWLSPAFPVGGYAYSHGLEQVIAAGDVTDAASLSAWLRDVLRFGAGRMDAALLAAAHRGEDAAWLTQVARSLAASKERWDETEALGRAFAEALRGATGDGPAPMPYPVAVGVAAQALSLGTGTVAEMFLHAFASNLVSCAVRFVPLGQNEGQAVLAGLHGVIVEVAAQAVALPVDEVAASVPRADLAAMAHETMETRIFRT
ncbi:MAG: urease accessory UreF family protein [Rhodobacter sp.]|nr:urease accessory UreF family protein [Rhodobacter sp.]